MDASELGWQITYTPPAAMVAPAVNVFQCSCTPAVAGAFAVLGNA